MPNERLTLLFDLDGPLVDTDPFHFRAFSILLEENQKPSIDLDLYKTRIMGFGLPEIFSMLFPERDIAFHRILADRKESLFRELVRDVTPAAGLLALLDWADERGVRRGVVTNAPRENAELLLGALGIAERFETLVIGEELEFGKPHPMPYLTGLQHLDGVASAAIAFEDSLSGVRSARAAGITTMGLASSLPESALLAAGASHTIEDFRDPRLWSELYRQIGETSVQADA